MSSFISITIKIDMLEISAHRLSPMGLSPKDWVFFVFAQLTTCLQMNSLNAPLYAHFCKVMDAVFFFELTIPVYQLKCSELIWRQPVYITRTFPENIWGWGEFLGRPGYSEQESTCLCTYVTNSAYYQLGR